MRFHRATPACAFLAWAVATPVALAGQSTPPSAEFSSSRPDAKPILDPQAPTSQPSPQTVLQREELTGDWSGAFTNLSDDLKDNLDLPLLGLERLRAEHQAELFYDVHITPWLQLTGDLQIIRPNRPDAGTAYVPGGRLRIVF